MLTCDTSLVELLYNFLLSPSGLHTLQLFFFKRKKGRVFMFKLDIGENNCRVAHVKIDRQRRGSGDVTQ